MFKNTIIISACLMIAVSCGQMTTRETARQENTESAIGSAEQAFLDNLASLCGKSFTGKETYIQPGRESWADKKFVMHVTVCGHDKVEMPFHLDEDRSRTWMFLAEDGRLRFRHDHRHEDGTPEDQTLYGGYADGSGTAFIQRFPADEYTIELLNDTLGRQWNIILADDLSTMEYQLQYHGEVVFSAEFDLTNPI